jgi:hypothetical protein
MRAPPSVAVDLPGSRRWAVAVVLLGALAAGAVCAAVLPHFGWDSAFTGAAVGAAAGIGAAAARRWAPHDRGRLCWDGAQWQFDGQPGELQVMLDLGRWMLLAFRAAAQPRRRYWLPVSDDHVPQALGLRAAVYCRALPSQNNPPLPGRSPE